jgi:hypothetical protein
VTQHKPEISARLLLLLGSTLIGLVLAEVGTRVFENATGSGTYFPGYLVDGIPVASLGLYTADPVLPFAMDPGYQHTVVDLAWHPVSFGVTVDDYGYRNHEGQGSEYDLVVAGDSVAFGYGVNDEETISAHLGQLTKTYSLAIPGAGPEMYMVMLERFLKRAKTARVAVLFYEGNDYQNLYQAFWKELGTCSPPGQARVIRRDVSSRFDEQLSSFALVRLARDIARRYFGNQLSGCELLGTYDSVSTAAIADLDNFENYEQKLKGNLPRALSYLQQLAAAPCVDVAVTAKIEDVVSSVRENETDRLASRMRNISVALSEENCYPLGSGFPAYGDGRSLMPYANYFAGYYYDYMSSLRNGYDGNVTRFRALLDQMEILPELSPTQAMIRRLKKILADGRDIESAREVSAALKASLAELAMRCIGPESCDKEGLFLDYLDALQGRELDVTIFTMTSENAVELFGGGQAQRICTKAATKGIKCLSLHSRFATHYEGPGAGGLYLDGAHLSVAGSALVARWMAEGLDLVRSYR